MGPATFSLYMQRPEEKEDIKAKEAEKHAESSGLGRGMGRGLASTPALGNVPDSLCDSGEVSSSLWVCFWKTKLG